MTTPIDVAMNRLAEIKAEMAELETFIRVYYRLYPDEKLSEILPGGPRMPSVENSVHKPVDKSGSVFPFDATKHPPIGGSKVEDEMPSGEPRVKLANAREIWGDIFGQLIVDANRPLTRGEMLERIEKLPHAPPLTSDDNAKYLGTLLWRNRNRFRNLPGYGYWLRNEPYAPAGYDPATDTPGAAVLDAEADTIEAPELPDTLNADVRQAYGRAVSNVRDATKRGADRDEYADDLDIVMRIEEKFPEVMVDGFRQT